MIIFGLGSLTAEHSTKIACLQLALFECIANYINNNGSSTSKYAIDPLFTEHDYTILSSLGYSVFPAQDNCVISSFLTLQESDRVLCYLPHLPLHLVLSALLSAPSGSIFLCPSVKKVLELEFLANSNSQLHHLSSKLKKLWNESDEYDWLKSNIITLQPIVETALLRGANVAYNCTSMYIKA